MDALQKNLMILNAVETIIEYLTQTQPGRSGNFIK